MGLKINNQDSSVKNVILVPTDFSEVCTNAISYTLHIAKHIKHRIVLLHVINNETLSYLEKSNLSTIDLEKKLELQAEQFSKIGEVEINYVIKRGKLLPEIHNAVKELGANMIVLGTHGKVGFQTITGSYAIKLINRINVPTIVVQQKTLIKPYKNIILPITIDTYDRQKTNWAIYISKIFNSTVHIFPKKENSKHLQAKINKVVEQTKIVFDKHNVKYHNGDVIKSAGNFTKQVIEYAMQNDADLIMTMMGAEDTLPFFNTRDEQIIFNTSQIPVICINAENIK